jgi:hypothetical protein
VNRRRLFLSVLFLTFIEVVALLSLAANPPACLR